MSNITRLWTAAFLCLVLVATPASAQQSQQSIDEIIDNIAGLTNIPKDSLLKRFSDLLVNNTETINKVLQEYVVAKSGLTLLRDLNLKFKTFRVNGQDNSAALGVSYSYSKDISRNIFAEKTATATGVSLALQADGNVAFEQRVNPQDFLDSKLAFQLFHSIGGVVDRADTAIFNRLNELEFQLAGVEDEQELNASPLWQEYVSTVTEFLSTQFYIDLALKGGLESNQDFSLTQAAYGLQLGLDLKAWNQHATLAKLNIPDWPFAVIRLLTGLDDELRPRGSAIPTVLLGIDQVDPLDDAVREALGEASAYPRFRGEVAFKTRVSRSASFVADFRYYKELGAARVIKTANLDEFVYFTSALTLQNGMFVSYTTGKLPFDAESDQIYELGFRYDFN